MAEVEQAEQSKAQTGQALLRIRARERLADEREGLADERERLADVRERLADARDEVTDELERLSLDRGEIARTPLGVVASSKLRLLESERGLDSARHTLSRSRALLERQQLVLSRDDNAARQQELAVVREMFASRVSADPTP